MITALASARHSAILSVATLALGLSACSSTTDTHEVHVDFMRLTVGTQQATVNSTGAVTGSIAITAGTATAVSVEFLNAAMTNALGEHADDFQVDVAPAAGITFTRSGPFAGTLTGSGTGVVAVSFALVHIVENHEDFGPFPVNITVNAPPAQR